MLLRLNNVAAGALAAAMLLTLPGPASAAPVTSEQSVVASMPEALLQAMARAGTPDGRGALTVNRSSWARVDYQRDTTLWAQYGIAVRDAGAIGTAQRIAAYAFEHQQSGGGFALGPGQSHAVGAAAWFVNDFSHTVALLRGNDWFANAGATAAERTRLARQTQRLGSALNYMVANEATLENDTAAVNRTFVYANLYFIGGKQTGNHQAVRLGNRFLASALDRQAADGTFPEAGGFDSSYQCVSLYEAQVLYLNMPAANPLHDRLWQAIVSGMARERRALRSDGDLSTDENTRVGPNTVTAERGGPVHHVDAVHAALAFEYFAAIVGTAAARRDAAAIAARYWGL
jgi:hypothetical protein